MTKYYLISLMLWDFFKFVAICLTFYVFWNLIHRFLGLIRASGKPHVAVTIIHYIFLVIIFLVSLAEWGMSVASYVRSVTSTNDDDMQWIWTQLIAAEYIVYWVLSTEILAWGIFVAIKVRSNSFVSKVSPTQIHMYFLYIAQQLTGHFQMPAMAFITAAISWCAVSSALAIIYIRYSLMPTYDGLPIYLNAAEAIIQFVLWVGTYTGILLCCAKWRNLGDEQKYPAPQFQPQYPPAQFQPQYLAQSPEVQYPPVQQQPYGVAPYLDHSAQPQAHPHHQPHHVSPQ